VFSAFIYTWHPNSIGTLEGYFSSSTSFAPTFIDYRFNYLGIWKTSITLHHWKFAPDVFPEGLIKVFDEERESGQIPP
jgi:hypothetical protein